MGRSPLFKPSDIEIGDGKPSKSTVDEVQDQEDQDQDQDQEDQYQDEFNLYDYLDMLKKGDEIKINTCHTRLYNNPRSVSIDFTMHWSSINSDITYVVDNDNYEGFLNVRSFEHFGKTYTFKSIALRDITIPYEDHTYLWLLTNDGYIRECEHYTKMYKITGIEIIECS